MARMSHPAAELPVIGWKEYVALPELGVPSLKAKIDTGARTSALHVAAIRRLSDEVAGEADLEITLAPDRRRPETLVRARVRQLARMRVTDSGGHSDLRPVIETLLVLGPVTKRIRPGRSLHHALPYDPRAEGGGGRLRGGRLAEVFAAPSRNDRDAPLRSHAPTRRPLP